MNDTSYQNALDYIYSYVDYSLTRAFRYSPEKFNLSRMEQLLTLIGNPHKDYRIIHLAGTKGKGSTAALIASAYQAEGYKVGFYSSPHLIDYCERIQVNGKIISQNDFVHLVNYIRPFAERVERITTFELTTAIAFLFFSIVGVDIAVIETGLGGRLDATNVVSPVVSVITSISIDHTAVLGETIEKISAEKAGIIKKGKPTVLGIQSEKASLIIQNIARQRGSKIYLTGRDYQYKIIDFNLRGQLILYEKKRNLVNNCKTSGLEVDGENQILVNLPLLGKHQAENGCTAYAVIDVASKDGIGISTSSIQKGFKNVFWPGRFEIIQEKPPIVIDSAHNSDSARRLSQTISEYLPDQQLTLIFGASEDKDIFGMLTELSPKFEKIIITESFHPRAMNALSIKKELLKIGRDSIVMCPVEKAIDHALANLINQKSGILATGSVFVASTARNYFSSLGYKIRPFEVLADVQDVITKLIGQSS